MDKNNVTVVMWAYNEKEMVQNCLELMKDMNEIIIVDNGSLDNLSEWLATQSYPYVYFDEGIQGYGKLLNLVIQNFQLNDIVIFMQPRFVLGKHCIDKVIQVLSENKFVGIAGPVSNGFTSPQHLNIKELDELWSVEASCKEKAYQAVGVSSGIWGTKKEILKQMDEFDEELVEPENVLLDYQLRLIEKGYKQVVIPQAVAFDIFCGKKTLYQSLLKRNDRDLLKLKWNMNYFNLIPNEGIIDFINKGINDKFNILEIGCDLGSTLLEIKHKFSNCNIYGIEINETAASLAGHLLNVKQENIEKNSILYKEKFDFIVFGDVLEHLSNPDQVIRNCRSYLNKDGCIIANIPNLMHISVMEQLINGKFQYEDTGLLDKTHIHFFTYHEIIDMFKAEGFIIECIESYKTKLSSEQENLKRSLLKLSSSTESFMYDTYQYLLRAKKLE